MNYFTLNKCGQDWHTFARNGEGEINAYHSDATLCETAEFNIRELLDDELTRIQECPWCLKKVLDEDHIRRCSNYKPAYSEAEIRDAYSDPTERAKRDSLLRDIQ